MIQLDVNRYRQFISEFRRALGVGHRENRGNPPVEVQCGSNFYRYNVADLYLTHTKTGGRPDWVVLERHNYAQMGIDDDFLIGGGKIKDALLAASPTVTDIFLLIVTTSEAARSQVVYQAVQQMLHDMRRKMPWSDLKPLVVGSWIYNVEENNKTKPVEYGALGSRDYYNEKAIKAIMAFRKLGFHID